MQLFENGCTRHRDILLWWGQTLDLNFKASFTKQLRQLFSSFLPITCCSCAWLSTWLFWWWVGPKFYSLLSVYPLIGAHFLTTKSNEHMHLLTRLYGVPKTGHGQFLTWSTKMCCTTLCDFRDMLSFRKSSHMYMWWERRGTRPFVYIDTGSRHTELILGRILLVIARCSNRILMLD